MSAASTAPEDATPTEPTPPNGGIRTGRNLFAATLVGVLLGGAALITLFTVKATFLIYMGAALLVALHELDTALRKSRDIKIPAIPVALGGAAMVTCAYWAAGGAETEAHIRRLLGALMDMTGVVERLETERLIDGLQIQRLKRTLDVQHLQADLESSPDGGK